MSNAKCLTRGVLNGYISDDWSAIEEFKPKLVVNDLDKGEKVLTSISDELKKCEEFFFSVAFITNGGITTLLNTLNELEEKGIRGTIIASQYQNFSQPTALRRLLKFSNIELRIVPDDRYHMHAKAYIFKSRNDYAVIVGSSNLTNDALCVNQEWNIKVSSTSKGSLIKQILNEFNTLYNIAVAVDEDWLEVYEKIYNYEKTLRQSYKSSNLLNTQNEISLYRINPNSMQVEALKALENTRLDNNNKALIISATGTGKTYLSAFDVKAIQPKRFLFVVHRELIAADAMNSFRKIIGNSVSMAVLGGKSKNRDADFLFSTIQTLSKDEILYGFREDEFEYIVIDEVHRAGAATYQKVINHFKPKFLLGMSATPERTDEFDIYKLFNHNVAYEIRLNHAMRENMVCPFHYFGISDITIDGLLLDDKAEFRFLESEVRVQNIIEKAEFYGFSGERVKGLVFCSRNDEAKVLSDHFNQKGYQTIALSGSDSNDKREESIKRLEQKEQENRLDYIFTVDIFNEGVDIPSINQVIMLRPTQSAIIFVQQLGRGLRHNLEKEYVVVLDFIGNYSNNFFIPVALSGDNSFNKDNLRRFVVEGNRVIPGCSTVNFDEISRKKIFSAIDSADFNSVKSIRESYSALRFMLGRIPSLFDFEKYGSIDPVRFFDNKSLGSYHDFLKKYETDYQTGFSEEQEEVLEFISRKFAQGKRLHELVLLKIIMHQDRKLIERLIIEMQQYGIELTDLAIINVTNIMTNNFITGSAKNTYQNCVFIQPAKDSGFDYRISDSFAEMLKNTVFKNCMIELIEFGIQRNRDRYGNRYRGTDFQLYQKYTYEDVCRLLNWEKGEVALNIGGYKYDKKSNTFPVFINYEKDENVNHSINYEDRFISPNEMIAISKSGRTAQSDDIKTIYNAKHLGVEMHLFVRKNKDDKISKEFYYLGMIEAVGAPKEIIMKNTDKSAVEIRYKLHTEVRRDIYDYFM